MEVKLILHTSYFYSISIFHYFQHSYLNDKGSILGKLPNYLLKYFLMEWNSGPFLVPNDITKESENFKS